MYEHAYKHNTEIKVAWPVAWEPREQVESEIASDFCIELAQLEGIRAVLLTLLPTAEPSECWDLACAV